MRTLDVRHETALPVRELSALALGSRPGEPSRLLAVGDEDFAVISAQLEDGKPELARRHDLRLPLGNSQVDISSASGSDFEGVACDGDGTVFLLQEKAARLVVLAADLSRLLQVIALAVPADHPELG